MDSNAPEAKRSLRLLFDADVRSDTTTRFATSEDPGRTDLTFILRGRGTFIEVKAGGLNWTTRYADPAKGWTQPQREWARRKVQNGSEVWLWLTVGLDPTHYDPIKYMPRRTYLIPFPVAIEVVESVERLGINSVPYRLSKGGRIALRHNNLSCQQFSPYELYWAGDGVWTIPEKHLFYERFIR